MIVIMNDIKFFIGADIGSETFSIGVYDKKRDHLKAYSFSNDSKGFEKLSTLFTKRSIDPDLSVVCIENTGVYTEGLLYHLHQEGFKVALESPLRLKKTFRLSQKTDETHALQIADYASRYLDKLVFWQPPKELLEIIRSLLSLREQYVEQRTANKNLKTSFSRKRVQPSFSLDSLERSIQDLNKKIEAIEKELKKHIESDPDTKNKVDNIKSMTSVGMLLAVNLFCVTEGFSKRLNPKQIAAYLGIAPYDYESGKTVFRKPRSKGFGPARLRKLLYLASMSIVQHDTKMKKYYLRKLEEGKSRRRKRPINTIC